MAWVSLAIGVFSWWLLFTSLTNWASMQVSTFLIVLATVFVLGGSGFIFGTVATVKKRKRIVAAAGMLLNVGVFLSPVYVMLAGVRPL